MIVDHNTMGATRQLKVPKAEPSGGRNFSPKSVLHENTLALSSSSDESRSSSDSEVSSNHSDRSDSAVDYEAQSETDDEEECQSPRAKKRKLTTTRTVRGEEESFARKKSRTKTTAQRADCYAPKQRTTNPGRRVVGKRIYDSVLGRTCHWCRQKTVELHVECSRCPIRFCGQCLLNRNGEVIAEEMMKNVRWICPKCRGGCGLGCKNCCNCGPCRKSQKFEPTGQLVTTVRRAGFSNVHDYLVHLKTGEDPDTIAKRKEGRGWTKATGALVYRSGADDSEKEDEDPGVKQVNSDDEEDVKQHDDDDDDEEEEEDSKQKVDNEPGQKYSEVHEKNESRTQRITRGKSDLPGSEIKPRHAANKNSADDFIRVDYTEDDHGPSSCTQGNEFARKLECTLRRPFSTLQLKQMMDHVNYRKPIMKLRQTRSRAIEVPCSTEGRSYLDHYPDLAEKLAKANLPDEKLRLLRGFLFWLQHSCMDGAVRPWADAETVDGSGECTEVSGPDCQVIRVLLAIDENEDHHSAEWEDMKPVISMENKLLQPRKEIVVKPTIEIKVKQEKED